MSGDRAAWDANDAEGLRLLGFEPVEGICPRVGMADFDFTPADLSERSPSRRERLDAAAAAGREVCPSCGMEHAMPVRLPDGRIYVTPCFIDTDIWQAVVDVARGQGAG